MAALSLVDNIKNAKERATLQFRLLIQLGVALTGRHGYSAAAVESTTDVPHGVCGDSAEADMLYPIMEASPRSTLFAATSPLLMTCPCRLWSWPSNRNEWNSASMR